MGQPFCPGGDELRINRLVKNAMMQNAAESHYNMVQYNYSDVIISVMVSQITSISIVYSTVCLGADQRKHQSSASLAFVRGIHQWSVNLPAQRAAENVSIWEHNCVTKMGNTFIIGILYVSNERSWFGQFLQIRSSCFLSFFLPLSFQIAHCNHLNSTCIYFYIPFTLFQLTSHAATNHFNCICIYFLQMWSFSFKAVWISLLQASFWVHTLSSMLRSIISQRCIILAYLYPVHFLLAGGYASVFLHRPGVGRRSQDAERGPHHPLVHIFRGQRWHAASHPWLCQTTCLSCSILRIGLFDNSFFCINI